MFPGILLFYIGQNFHQQIGDLLHILHRDILEAAVEIGAAGAQIGARQTHEAEPGAVGATADGNGDGGDAHIAHSLLRPLHDIHAGLDLSRMLK